MGDCQCEYCVFASAQFNSELHKWCDFDFVFLSLKVFVTILFFVFEIWLNGWKWCMRVIVWWWFLFILLYSRTVIAVITSNSTAIAFNGFLIRADIWRLILFRSVSFPFHFFVRYLICFCFFFVFSFDSGRFFFPIVFFIQMRELSIWIRIVCVRFLEIPPFASFLIISLVLSCTRSLVHFVSNNQQRNIYFDDN